MPACTTPELWPVWWVATAASFSKTTTGTPLAVSCLATASPTIPAPTMPTGAAARSELFPVMTLVVPPGGGAHPERLATLKAYG